MDMILDNITKVTKSLLFVFLTPLLWSYSHSALN